MSGDGLAGAIGIVGACGQVGLAAARALRSWYDGPLVVGAREPVRAEGLAAELGVRVTARDSSDLAAFSAGCAVVVNCAGPASVIGTAVAEAGCSAGAHYVDAAGDDPLLAAVRALPWPQGRSAVLSAGMMPGLTGLLPRLLVTDEDKPEALTGWVGGCDTFTRTAALDYLDASAAGFGEPLAAWRNGARSSRALTAESGVRPPFFPGPVHALPYLSTETERLARDLGLTDVDWYSVFDGDRTFAALATDADRLCRAAELDAFGRTRYQLLVFTLTTGDAARTLVCRGTGASRLTGTAAALAALAIAEGRVEPGAHHLAEVVDPAWAADRLRGADAVTAFEVVESGDTDDEEEGAL